MTGARGSQWGRTAPIDPARCGTEANHKRHLRLGENPCEDCRLAYNRAKVDRYQKRKAKGVPAKYNS